MGCYRLAIDERETILSYVYTAVRKHMNKFEKLGWECTKVEYYPDGEVFGKFYKVPNCAISFRSPEKRKVNLTEEQREALRERMRNLHR